MIRRFAVLLILTLVYLLVLGSLDPWDILTGLVLATLLLWLFRRFVFASQVALAPHTGRALLAFVPFVIAVARDVVSGTWSVALVVLHLHPLREPGIVEVPIGARTETGVAVTALVSTLSPGSVLLDVDWSRGIMLFHLIDASDPDAVRAGYKRFYERYQRFVFP